MCWLYRNKEFAIGLFPQKVGWIKAIKALKQR